MTGDAARGRRTGRAALAAALCVFGWVAEGAAEPRGGGYVMEPDEEIAARHALVQQHIAPEIESEAVVQAMDTVPRHLFVPPEYRNKAYRNTPL